MKLLRYPFNSQFAGAALLALCAVLPARADYQSTVLSQGPVGYWRLGETVVPSPLVTNAVNLGTLGAPDNAIYSGNQGFFRGYPGALASSDTAALFNGSNQKVQTAYDAAVNPAANWSAEAWLAPTVVGAAIPGGLTCALSCGHFGSPRSGWLIY